jgi:outer membrane protein OmpA-like peptidoglycan-associated protein
MKTFSLLTLLAGAGLMAGCATVIPMELASAREAYRQASNGPAARLAPAELHVASQALARAEQSFQKDAGSYRTRDLAYVAHRKSELAAATAAIAMEQDSQARAGRDYQATQAALLADSQQDLGRTRRALTASEQSGDRAAADLDQTRSDLAASQVSGDLVAQDLDRTRTALAVKSERLGAEQEARLAAEQRAALAQAALAKLAEVREEPRGLVITLSGSVLFATNRSALLPAARTRLDRVAEVLLTHAERNVTVEGHTDSRGSNSHNIELSQGRADAVRDYLVLRGYQADLVKAQGLGEGHPVADNATAEGRANNRRVEIIIQRDSHASNP